MTTTSPTAPSATPTKSHAATGLTVVVVGSMAIGLVAALALVAAPFIPADEGAPEGDSSIDVPPPPVWASTW